MNADVLLEHFHRLGDAPDAVPRLRRFILDLAVQGKLIAPTAAWRTLKIEDCLEPLSDGRLIHQGWSPQCATHPSPKENVWGVLKTTSIQDGYFLDEHNKELPEQLQPKPLLEVHEGDILLTCAGPRARCGVACLVRKTRKKLMISGKMYRFRPKESMLSNEFLALFLRSAIAQVAINGMKTGSSESGLNLTHERFRTLAVSVPPLAEQHRIVTKVDGLMALCDRLEAAQQEREQRRTRLTAASWQALTTESEPNAARFALEQLPALTTRPQQIAALRQTILDLAVRGKLVEQDAKDEPAEVLLKRIAKEKESQGTKSKRQTAKAQDRADVAGPFELPNGWTWACFPELGKFGRGKSKHRPRNDRSLYVDGTYPLVQTGDVARSKGVVTTYTNLYNDVGLAQSAMWPKGTLCITVAANIADSGILSLDACFPDSVVGFIPAACFSNARYFEYFLRTAQADLLKFAPATAQKNINLEILEAVRIPLPPLAEQRRIVAKVDELMRLCDRLEVALQEGEKVKGRLLEAVLAGGAEPKKYAEPKDELRMAAEP